MKYKPKFRPDDYLRFLKEIDFKIHIEECLNIFSLQLWTCLWSEESTLEMSFPADNLDKCFDDAILRTGFDKILEENK